MGESVRKKRQAKQIQTGLKRLLTAFLLVFLFLSFSCAPAGPGGVEVDPPVTSPPAPPGEAPLQEKDPAIDRGLPGSRSERLTLALADPEKLNFNPFAEGEGLFPVDPTGRRQPVYETLITFDPLALDYVPLLAEKVRLKDDLITVDLADGRKWHDGFAITSADLLFSIETHTSFRTPAGLLFESLISRLEIDSELSLRIEVEGEAINAGIRCMEALASALVVPRHVWEPFLTDRSVPDQLTGPGLPRIGSGPWSFYGEDEFVLSLEAFSGDPDPAGGISYLSILKYARPDLARRALLRGDLDLILLGSSLESVFSGDWREALGQDQAPVLPLLSGEKWAGLTINPEGQELLGLASFRQLLLLAADTKLTSSLLMPDGHDPSPSDTFTLPSLMVGLDREQLASGIPEADRETINLLLVDSNLLLNRDTGRLEWKAAPLPPLELIYPENYQPIEEACRLYQESAGRLGVEIILRSLPQSQWRQLCQEGDFDLAYTESTVNESPARLADRLLQVPGLDPEEAGADLPGFDGAQGQLLIHSIGKVQTADELREVLEDLGLWLIRERLLIPLAAGGAEAGLWNPAQTEGFDFGGLFPAGVRAGTPGLD